MFEIVCFTGNSGLTDYSVSLARAMGARTSLVTSTLLPEHFRQMGFTVITPFRRSRHYPFDLIKFIIGVVRRRPGWTLWQGPLKFPLIDGVSARLLRIFGLRCIVIIHDILPHYPRSWSRITFGFYYRSFERVIVHSQSALANIRELGVRKPALIVPHGIYDIFKLTHPSQTHARQRINGLGTKRDEIVVLFFGHLESRKGIFEFLEAAALLKNNRRLTFLVSGQSSLSNAEEQKMHIFAKKAGNVVLHTRRIPFEEVELHFTAADIVALPYQEGTTSGVLKLAFAFEKPVVASQIGDFNEQIHSNSGICVSLGADFSERFALALSEVADDLPIWSQRVVSGNDHLQWSTIANQIKAFLEQRE